MKYLVYWEFCPEDMDKITKKFVEYQNLLEKNPDKYQTYLYPPHGFAGQTSGFSIIEATPEQINNGSIYWNPILKMKYKPIIEAATQVKQYMESK